MNTINKNSKALLTVVLFFAMSLTGLAQENPGKDPMQECFFHPELVMRYQNEIQLKKEQKETIISTMEEAQKKFTRLQWDLQAEMTVLQKLLSESTVSEPNALAQLDKVLDQERLIKKAQITLMVKIKNALTEEQKVKLNVLKGK
jgi:Spy/CpxP family protein refolding chaperone